MVSSEDRTPEENTPENNEENNGANNENRPRRRRGWIIGGIVAAGLLVLTVGAVALVLIVGTAGDGGGVASSSATFEEEYVSGEGDPKIAVIPVDGVISAADSTVVGAAPTTTPQGLRDALDQAEEDEGVEAVVLEIDSPGGGVTASDQMYRLTQDFKESADKPVVVSMASTAASGGYYIATAADEIFANETTITGSLGVILQFPDLSEAANELGAEVEIVKSGRFKDMGSPFRGLTEQEREIFESIVNDSYIEFVEVIVEGRGLSEERVRELADGRPYSGKQAAELDLVDELGGLESAAQAARDRADVEQARVVRYVQSPGLAGLLQARLAPQKPTAVQAMEAAGLDLSAEPQYLYLPGR